MNKPWIAVSAAVLLASPGAYAAGAGGIGEGDMEAGISVSLASTELDFAGSKTDSDVGIIEIAGGKFFTDQLEAKVGLSAVMTTDSDAGTLKLGADYLFTGPSATEIVPFVGGAFGLGMFDTETDFLDVHGGIKYFFRERTSIEAKLSFLSPTDSAYDSATDLTVGINIYF
jgi:hypothetical protein